MKNPQLSSRLLRFCQLHPDLWAIVFAAGGALTAFASRAELGLSQPLFLLGFLILLSSGYVFTTSGPSLSDPLPEPNSAELPPGISRCLLAGILLLAGAIRLTHINFGFPFYNHPDEGNKGEIVSRMLGSGSLNPHYFLHPSLLLYLSAALTKISTLLSPAENSVERAVLAGRVVSAMAGTLSVALVFLIGKRLFSWRTGLTAAAFLAAFPLHVTCSRYMKEDALCIALVLAVLVAALKAIQEKRSAFLLLAGFLCGASASAKYTGILSAVLFFLVLVSARADKLFSAKVLAAAFLLIPVGFFVFTPYSLLDSQAFLKNFMTERAHMRFGHEGIAITAWSQWWTYHWSRSILSGIGFLPALLAAAGCGLIASRPKQSGFIIVIAFLIFYLPAEWVKAKPPPQPERYILGCLPFLALFSAEFLDRLLRRGRPLLANALCFCAVVVPAARSVSLARDLALDTRQQAREWMIQNIDPKKKILIEAAYSPRLADTEFEPKLSKAAHHPQKFTVSHLKESGFDYLLVNSFSYGRYFTEPEYDELLHRRFERIFSSFPLVKEFAAPSGTYGFHNPVVRLYRLTEEK